MSRWLPVNDAAIALGVSVATLKRRLKAGTVPGRQEKSPSGFRWYVEVPGDEGTGQEGAKSEHADDARDQVIIVLQQQVQELWAEVGARREEVRELHVLLQRAQSQIPIPAAAPLHQLEGQQSAVAEPRPDTPDATPNGVAQSQKTPWWRFWR